MLRHRVPNDVEDGLCLCACNRTHDHELTMSDHSAGQDGAIRSIVSRNNKLTR